MKQSEISKLNLKDLDAKIIELKKKLFDLKIWRHLRLSLMLSFLIICRILLFWAVSKLSSSFLKYAQEYCLLGSKNKSYKSSLIS